MTTPFPFGSGNTLLASQLNAITTLPINDQTASYVALVGDVGKRIVMNVATANTVTINNSVFAVGDQIFIACKGAGSTTVTAGAGVTINTASSLVLAQHGGGTLVALSASVFTFFNHSGLTYGTATGGIGAPAAITVGGINYNLLTFNASGLMTVTKSGLFDALIFSGGAGGASTVGSVVGGGGGAGGVSQQTIYLSANTTITIGAGGAANASGSSSSIDNTARALSVAGGGTGSGFAGVAVTANKGGSGGGGGNGVNTGALSMAPSISGFAGGDAVSSSNGGGGGGGATAVGANGVSTTGGAGGAGYDINNFTGAGSVFKAGGGGGGGTTGGAGGSSVGGAGGSNTAGAAAAANTASGGGGGAPNALNAGGAGGSGIVLIRFKV